jgi:hypothetical protein
MEVPDYRMIEPDMPLNNDTSHGQALRWTKWLGHLAGKPELNFLEVGSYEGQSAIWFLRNLLTAHDSRILCVDTWRGGEDMPLEDDDRLLDVFRKNTEPWASKLDIMQERSDVALPMLHAETFDFAYIDGSHMARNVLSDSVMVWRLLKVGGICIWDDYLLELEFSHVKQALDAFLLCYWGCYECIAQEYQVCLKKIKA